MAKTRAFRSGNSQAVRIPAEIAFQENVGDLTITRSGDVITIFPARQGLKEAVAKLRAMACAPPMEENIPIQLPDRPGL